jgi:pimeloyl-ACP methyl ester carboxylesterase
MATERAAFRERQKTVLLDGLCYLTLKVVYTDLGEGEPVVLLHGIPTWSFLYYRDAIPWLADECRVRSPVFLGHGYSDRRDRFDRSLAAQARMILAFLDALEIERATIVGHDTGGGVALILGIEHAERVARLVLTNAVTYDCWPIEDMIALGNPESRSKTPREVANFVASALADGVHNLR